MARRLIIIGAGPIGLEAALLGCALGFEVSVLERERVGAALWRSGSARFFSPFAMNLSLRARAVLADAGVDLPRSDALLTGPALARDVLEPLAATQNLAGRVRIGTRVLAVARAGLGRGDLRDHPIRGERPFRVLIETPKGEEIIEAERVIDASGAGIPAWIGVGVPALGERSAAARTIRQLGALDQALDRLAERVILLVGHGHSAAHALTRLAELAERAPGTSILWAIRSAHRRPVVAVANDPLPERRRLVDHANSLAESPPSFLAVVRSARIDAIETGDRLTVRLSTGRTVEVDTIAAFCGYRPDSAHLSELAISLAPSTEGSARLDRALANLTDCLSTPPIRPEDLASGEPGFFFAGTRSYGRRNTFLLQSGRAQLETLFEVL